MRIKHFNIIVITTAIALSGIIVTQFFWVKDAVNMKNDQFYQNAHLGLKRVVNQLMVLQNDSTKASKFITANSGLNYHTQFIESLDPNLIKEMINTEFNTLELSSLYQYGIFNSVNNEFIMLSDEDYSNELLKSKFTAPISCIFQTDQFILAVVFPSQQGFVYSKMQIYIFLSALFMLIVISGFWFIASSLLKQKKLSEMKTDFVNNMTHEFKTPIATVSITSEMLMKEEIQKNPERVNRYAKIIYHENQRLKNQVDQVLHMSILDRGSYTLNLSNVDLHDLIRQTTDHFHLTISQRDGTIKERLNAANAFVYADKSHLTNVLNNLIDNANKYSPGSPQITISTHSTKKGVYISIEDRGIGIPEQYTKDIFKKFNRVPTGDVHDVKGFGIGLFYVKTILMAHGGKITVNSKLGNGSNFIAFIPFKNIKHQNNLDMVELI